MPARELRQTNLDHGQAVVENAAAKWVWGTFIAIVTIAWVAFQIPLPSQSPNYAIYQPANVPPQALIGLNPTDAPETSTPMPLGTPTETPLSSPTVVGTPSATPTPIVTPTPTVESTQINALCTPTSNVPTFTFTPSATSSAFTPSSTPSPTQAC